MKFLLTRPSRDVTVILPDCVVYIQISTHTSLAGRDAVVDAEKEDHAIISTHTPLAGRDEPVEVTETEWYNFYSHVPRGT